MSPTHRRSGVTPRLALLICPSAHPAVLGGHPSIAVERLGVDVLTLLPEQDREVVDRPERARMRIAELATTTVERLAVHRLGVSILALIYEQLECVNASISFPKLPEKEASAKCRSRQARVTHPHRVRPQRYPQETTKVIMGRLISSDWCVPTHSD